MRRRRPRIRLAVIWIDWYPYHVARMQGLLSAPELAGQVAGIELVGGIGVHAGLRFREEIPHGLPVHTLMPDADWARAGQLRLSFLLWRYLDRLGPEAVLIPGYYTLPGIAAALWTRVHGRKSILMTESTAEDHLRSGWKERLKSQLLRTLFDAAVAGGKAHVRYLTHLGFPKERIGLYYDVVDNTTYDRRTSQIRRVSPGQFALPSNPYFLYVGRLSPEKNIFELVYAWLSYREAGGNWPLVIVGDGPCMQQIRASVEGSKQAEALLLVGHKSSEELPIYYAFAGCFVLPSTREPWGLVVNEAMACGLPVLVSVACGSSEDLVEDGANGLTFKPGTGELVTRLHQMSNLNSDQRNAMGTRSRMIIANYSPQRFGSEVQSLIFSPEA